MKRFIHTLPLLLLAACASQPPAPVVDRTTPVAAKSPDKTVAGATYTVKRGETLYRIALERGIPYQNLAAWNNISDPSTLKEGQVLRLTPPGSTEAGVAVAQPVQSSAAVETRPLDGGTPPTPVASDKIKREPKVNKELYSDGAWESLQKGTDTTASAATPAGKPETRPAGATDAGLAISWAWPSAAKVVANYGDKGNKGIDFAGKEGEPVTAAADGKVFFVGLQKGYGNLLIIGHASGFISVYAHNRKVLVAEKQTVSKGQKVAEMGKSDSDSVKLHFEIRQAGKPIDPSIYLPRR